MYRIRSHSMHPQINKIDLLDEIIVCLDVSGVLGFYGDGSVGLNRYTIFWSYSSLAIERYG